VVDTRPVVVKNLHKVMDLIWDAIATHSDVRDDAAELQRANKAGVTTVYDMS
jgi:hypothetical protein